MMINFFRYRRVVFIFGGIGNQLFQFVSSLAYRDCDISEILFLDLNKAFVARRDNALTSLFGIKVFNVPFPKIVTGFLKISCRFTLFRKLFSVLSDVNFGLVRSPRIMFGYFQSHNMVISNLDYLFSSFPQFNPQLCGEFIGIHVRRGDFFGPGSPHGVLDTNWYLKAIDLATQSAPGSRLIFFSDDIAWVRENFSIRGASFCDLGDPLEELMELSKCKHLIMSNSTFSYWASMLREMPGLTIAPSHWMIGVETRTLPICDPSWVLLDVSSSVVD